jgi:hypothetical protein
MTIPDDIRSDLGPDVPEDIALLAVRLREERPLPTPAFRGQLRRRLQGRTRQLAPGRLRGLIAGYAAAGTVLLIVGTISAAGIGPLGS